MITFSILSGLLGYTFMSFNMIMFRKKWPLGTIKRGYVHPFHPLPAIVLLLLCAVTYFAVFLGYGTQLVAMMVFYIVASLWFALPPLQVREARRPVHDALAAAGRLLSAHAAQALCRGLPTSAAPPRRSPAGSTGIATTT